MLAVSLLVHSCDVAAAATTRPPPLTTYETNFGKVDSKLPKGKLNAHEFKQYYELQERSKVTDTSRGLQFNSVDQNFDRHLS